jgi:tetratricopeptide (TPR) repeat protein
LHGQFDDFLACVDRLDKAVGGDPLLDAYRAIAYLHKGNLDAAKKCVQNAAAAEPGSILVGDTTKMLSQAEKNAVEPAGEAEAQAFAEAFEKAAMAGDKATVRAAFDAAAISRRAVAKAGLPEKIRANVELSLASGVGPGLADDFVVTQSEIEKGARLRLLHIHREGGEQRALLRLVDSRDDLGYRDCTLMRHADGKVRIDDYYPFDVGELVSDSLGRVLALGFKPQGDATQAAVAGPENYSARLSKALSDMGLLIKVEKYQEALDIFQGLPDRLQSDKTALSMRIQAARRLGGKPYDDAVIAYRKDFRSERNMDLIMIDAYSAHKLYDKVLASIDGLEKTVGGDPYLDALRAKAYLQKGDLAAAKRCGRKSLAGEPDLPATYLCLLAISLQEKKFADTSALLTTMREKFPRRMPKPENDPAYAQYLGSPQYRAWMKAKKPSPR